MTINSVALIAGALGFSAALVWNKAVNETLEMIIPKKSSILQAIVTTFLIVIIVFLVNMYIKVYNNITDTKLKESTVESGGGPQAKVTVLN